MSFYGHVCSVHNVFNAPSIVYSPLMDLPLHLLPLPVQLRHLHPALPAPLRQQRLPQRPHEPLIIIMFGN